MAEATVLTAEARSATGKGAARATRRAGRIPAIIYGDGKEPVTVSLDTRGLRNALNHPGFFSTLYDLDVGGERLRVLARDVQLDPVKDTPLHVDFLRVSAASRIHVEVPVHFINEEASPGLKHGGVLNIVRHEIELSCRADSIPHDIVVDLTGREVGDSIHISDVTLPEGVQPTITDRDFTIATIAAPTVQVEVEPRAAGEEEAPAAGAPGAAPEES
jgi:large subunit ribosomal protein L25